MKEKKKPLLKGIVNATLLAVVIYFCVLGVRASNFCVLGVRASNVLSFIPFLNSFIQSIPQAKLITVCFLCGILYLSINCFSKLASSIIAGAAIFIVLFWYKDLLPALWTSLQTFLAG